jgi:hypothetical protein
MKIHPATKSIQAGRVTSCAPAGGILSTFNLQYPTPSGVPSGRSLNVERSMLNVGCSRLRAKRGGFTLLEVMFAVVAFCTATFAILALVSQSLDMARRLQRPMVDAGLVASQLSLTNSFVEGTASGDLGDLLGDQYHGYTWDYAVEEAQTNKLFQVVIAVQSNEGGKPVVSKMTVLFYRPNSPAGSRDGGIGIR